jgi:hypothetical protein
MTDNEMAIRVWEWIDEANGLGNNTKFMDEKLGILLDESDVHNDFGIFARQIRTLLANVHEIYHLNWSQTPRMHEKYHRQIIDTAAKAYPGHHPHPPFKDIRKEIENDQ